MCRRKIYVKILQTKHFGCYVLTEIPSAWPCGLAVTRPYVPQTQGGDTHVCEHVDWRRVRGVIVQSSPLWPAGQGCSETMAGCSWVQGMMGGDALMGGGGRAQDYMGLRGSLCGLTANRRWGPWERLRNPGNCPAMLLCRSELRAPPQFLAERADGGVRANLLLLQSAGHKLASNLFFFNRRGPKVSKSRSSTLLLRKLVFIDGLNTLRKPPPLQSATVLDATCDITTEFEEKIT